MLMTKMPGKPLGEVWHSISFAAKSRLVREVARSSACLFRHQLRGIGNIYGKHSTSTEEISPLRDPVQTEGPVLANSWGSDISSVPGNGSSGEALLDVGRIVSMQFFWARVSIKMSSEAHFAQARTGSQLAFCSAEVIATWAVNPGKIFFYWRL